MICQRSLGGNIRDCACRLPDEAGWAECPSEFRGIIIQKRPALSGEFCQSCGSPNMVRAGTCMLCRDCGDSSGGCS